MYRVRDMDTDIIIECIEAEDAEQAVIGAVVDLSMSFPSAMNFLLEVENEHGEVLGKYEANVAVQRVVTCTPL